MEKAKIFDGVKWIEFDSIEEYNTYMDTIDPNRNLPTDSDLIKNLEHEFIGKEVIRGLYITLRKQNLTQAQDGDLLGRLNGVMMALGFGFIRGARVLAGNLTVGGQLTQARKDYITSKIDEAITKL